MMRDLNESLNQKLTVLNRMLFIILKKKKIQSICCLTSPDLNEPSLCDLNEPSLCDISHKKSLGDF